MNERIIFAFAALLFFIMLGSVSSYAQGYISPFKYENGTFKNKTSDEIRRESAKASTGSVNTPSKFVKPRKGPNSLGEIWIDGYCRYRPPASYNKSRYNEAVSENEYNRATFPHDTIITADDFSGNGTIPWAANLFSQSEEEKCKQLQQRMTAALNDGLPFPMYDSLMKLSWYHIANERGYKKGREYEFSRSISFWVKRKSGPDKMYIKLTTEFPYTNGEDYTNFEINDNGQFKIGARCNNCKDTYDELKSGKTKAWKEGDWNEITVKKDEFNTVSFFINAEKLFQYQIPDIPISIRFAQFSLKMPSNWEKEKLMYHIGQVTSISYPKMQ